MNAEQAVRGCGGAARWDRLRHLTTRHHLKAAVARGELRQPLRGLYAVPDCPPALLAAVAVRGVQSCHTAAETWGLPLVDAPERPHVTAARGSTTAWRHAVVHRRDVVDLNGCTDAVTTVMDCLRCLPPRVALVPLDAALARGLISDEDLHLAAKKLNVSDPRRRLVLWADAKAGSPLESVARHDLLTEGYEPETQEYLEPAGYVDFLIDGWLVIEVDGRRYHSDDPQFAEDRRRDAELRALGYTVLRFTWDQVLERTWWLDLVARTHAGGNLRTGPRAPM